MRIRTQHFWSMLIRIWWPKIGKNLQLRKFIFFWSTIGIYSSLGLHIGRPSYKRSLYPSKENIPQFKLEISVCPSGSGYGSSRLKLMRIHTNPDPKHCFFLAKNIRKLLIFSTGKEKSEPIHKDYGTFYPKIVNKISILCICYPRSGKSPFRIPGQKGPGSATLHIRISNASQANQDQLPFYPPDRQLTGGNLKRIH